MAEALKVMSTLAVKLALKRSLLPAWADDGREISMAWNPTGVLVDLVRGGEFGDVIIAIDAPVNDLAADGILQADTITPIARAGFGLAVRVGGPVPDISTVEAFRNALLSARSVAYSKTGASGIHFLEVVERLGIADVVRQRAVAIPAGFTAEKLVSGEADMAIQQISELMSVDGVEIAGPFPEPMQKHTDFSAAVFAKSRNAKAASGFIEFLTTPAAMQAYATSGLTPRKPDMAA